jgi:hypothetical protein
MNKWIKIKKKVSFYLYKSKIILYKSKVFFFIYTILFLLNKIIYIFVSKKNNFCF